jgi:hypothetical protein
LTHSFSALFSPFCAQLLAKLFELNSAVAAAGGEAISAEEEAQLRDAARTLEATSRYHASSIAPGALAPLAAKVLPAWPLPQLFPALDFLRVAVTHPSGAAAVAGMVPALLPALARAGGAGAGGADAAAAARPAALLAARLLFNALKAPPARAALLRAPAPLLAALAALLRFPHASVAAAAAAALHNLARALADDGGAGAAALAADAALLGALWAAVVGDALGAGFAGEDDARLLALLAAGSLLCGEGAGVAGAMAGAARGAGLGAAAAALAARAPLAAAAAEVQRALEAAGQ